MAVKIRLKRMGGKGEPFYRIVVADSRVKRDGRVIEEVGFYDPKTTPATISVKEERIIDWLKKGAQPTIVTKSILKTTGLWKTFAAQ